MKSITYNNINLNITLANICTYLVDFWIKEISKSNYYKIWLTIIVFNKKNKKFTLINNLPFNTFDYTDVVIVLKQVLDSKLTYYKKEVLDSVTININFENNINIKNKVYTRVSPIKLIFIFILLLLVIFILLYTIFLILFDLNQIFFYNNDVLTESYLISTENINNIYVESSVNSSKQIFIFDPFIKMFDKSEKYGFYFPSYFLPSNLKAEIENQDLNLLEYIIYNQYEILAHYTQIFSEYSLKINSILN